MRLMFRRALITLTATAAVTTAAIADTTAAMADDTTPEVPVSAKGLTAPGFAACPVRPSGAIGNWTCYFLTVLEGKVTFKNVTIAIDQPIRMTVAEGFMINGTLGAAASDLTGGPFNVVVPPPAAGSGMPDLTGAKLELYGTGLIKPGLLVPSAIGVKARLVHPLLGDNCWLGSNDAPIVIKPVAGSVSLGFVDSTPALKVKSSDARFTLPGASGCGTGAGLTDAVINSAFGLPSAVGDGRADWLYGVWSAQY